MLYGVLFLLRLRSIYSKHRNLVFKKSHSRIKTVWFILGFVYIILGFGILFDYLIYLLIFISKPFKGFILFAIEQIIEDNYILKAFLTPILAFVSALAISQCFLGLYYFTNNKYINNKHHKSSYILIYSVLEIMLFGFECLPYFLV
ncbi:MAG: hypothetical protein ACFE8E_04560 [Candidatus Hodarchaeota archaeon]